MRLEIYLAKKQITSQRFADQLSVSVSSVSKWRRGYRIPTRKMATKIEKATRGQVKAKDWVS